MKITITLFLVIASGYLFAQENQPIQIKASPTEIYIEKGKGVNYLNFEFLVNNSSTDTLTIAGIEISAFDKNKSLIHRKFIDGNGAAPSILTLPERVFNGNSAITIFNPFHTFDADLDLSDLKYEFLFKSNSRKQYSVFVSVKPKIYETKTQLSLPVKGKLLIEDGHDFYAHHRRFNYAHPFLQSLGFRSNFMRYSYDFITLNEKNESVNGDPTINENWYSFGKPLFAVAAGKVVAIVDSMPDNRRFDERRIGENQLSLFGNYIIIDHLNGEFSLYGHIKNKSAKIKLGDAVKPNQEIAAIGASGDVKMPHLHYELRTGSNHLAEGLPSYFNNFQKLGKKVVKGQVDTGDVIEN